MDTNRLGMENVIVHHLINCHTDMERVFHIRETIPKVSLGFAWGEAMSGLDGQNGLFILSSPSDWCVPPLRSPHSNRVSRILQ